MPADLNLFKVSPSTPIFKVIQKIDQNSREFVVVVDKNLKVLGTVTDGDIRRAILKAFDLKHPIKKIMNSNPKTIGINADQAKTLELIKKFQIRQLPIVSPEGKLVDVVFMDDLVANMQSRAYALIMAGGQGTRLRPLTDDKPKPMLSVGEKPILETIINQLRENNIRKIFIAINYKGKQIESHFKNGSQFGVDIEYLKESKKLGTAGALSLLPKNIKDTILVLNADLLTRLNFQRLLNFHEAGGYDATMAVKEFDYQVPYGVVSLDKDQNITQIDEKPVHRFFVNAGIYALSPKCISNVPKNKFLDITQLMVSLMTKKGKIGAFPVTEYWIDIGMHKDFEKANQDFNIHFES
jgi:dTDP-glucose pyrophosphorylase